MAPMEFEPAIPASERPQTHALGRAATGIDFINVYLRLKFRFSLWTLRTSELLLLVTFAGSVSFVSAITVLLLHVHHLRVWVVETMYLENKLFLLIGFYIGSFSFVLCQLD
jgi:hypothetical protein